MVKPDGPPVSIKVWPAHIGLFELAVGTGNGFTVTTICALGPSQPLLLVWLTQYDVLPAVVVDGVGAVALPVPPVAVVYHNKPVPPAVNAVAVAFKQYETGATTGAPGNAFTVTTITALGLSHATPLVVTVWLT